METNPPIIDLLAGWAPGLLIFTLKAAVVLCLVRVLLLSVHAAGPAVRHRLLSCAAAGILAIALLAPFLPEIPLPFLTAETVENMMAGPIRYEFIGERGELLSEAGTGRFQFLPLDGAVGEPTPQSFSLAPGALIWSIWFIGFALVAARMALRQLAVRNLVGAALPVDEKLVALARELAQLTGVTSRVRLRRHPKLATPFVAGMLRPVIVLPAQWDTLPRDIQDAILLHEHYHIRRADLLSQFCAGAVCALQWWNPLAWLAARRMARERELACDAAVLATGMRPSRYAATLLHLSNPRSAHHCAAVAPLSPAHDFKERIMKVLHSENRPRLSGWRVRLVTLVLAPAMLAVVGLVQPIVPPPVAGGIPSLQSGGDLVLSRARVLQGEAIAIEVKGDTLPTFARGRFNGHTIRLAAMDGAMRGLVPIGAEVPPGEYEVQVACTFADGTSRTLSAQLTVDARENRLVKWPFTDKTRMPTEIGDAFATSAEKPLWSGTFRRPLEGKKTAAFGLIKMIGEERLMHDGVDLAAPLGTPVLSTNAGVVVLTRELPASGKTVVIDHGMGLHSAYLHLDTIAVKEGARIASGSAIGTCGSTGRSTAPHLHWMMVLDGIPCDPLTFIEQF
jgi:beta-lactamase regulating signal transducer with metallopeptidase domain